jgi:hypothetical protein
MVPAIGTFSKAPRGPDGSLIGSLTVALAHGARRCDRSFFHHARQFERQQLFDINRGQGSRPGHSCNLRGHHCTSGKASYHGVRFPDARTKA